MVSEHLALLQILYIFVQPRYVWKMFFPCCGMEKTSSHYHHIRRWTNHLPWSSFVVSSYHFIDVTEQAVSLPRGMAEPRLSQIELVNICLACHRNVLQSSWVHWSTDEPTVILLGTGITANPPKKTNQLTVNQSQVTFSYGCSPVTPLSGVILCYVVLCQLGIRVEASEPERSKFKEYYVVTQEDCHSSDLSMCKTDKKWIGIWPYDRLSIWSRQKCL